MKKHIFSFIALLLVAQMAWAKVTLPDDIPSYYSTLNNKSAANLWTSVSSVAAKNRGNLGYDGLYDAYIKTDSYPADSVGKAGKVWDMYSDCGYEHNKRKCGSYSGECDCYNREHSIPKSWFGGSTSGIGCDIFHVVPTDGKVNGMRSAFVYGEVTGTPQYTSYSGHKKGNGAGILNARKTICASAGSTTPCSAGTVFEPIDEYKGDFARGYMGTMASWNKDMTKAEGSNFFQSSYTAEKNYGLTAYGVALLMKWHRQDPVSQKEIDRNNGIQDTQGNRNPFIDYPYLAEYIWGEHAGETVDMAKLIPSTDPAFIPGVSDGWRTDTVPPTPPTPPTPAVKYGVTWSANGEELYTDSVEENKAIALLPQEPLSCSIESNVFVGWTDAPIEDSTDLAPEHLYLSLPDFPLVTEDVTYYAVFAKADTTGSATPDTYVFDADSQDGWTCTASKTNDYWLLTDGKSIVSPKVDLARLESIVVKMRTYGGATFDKLDIYELDGKLTTMEATAGSTIEEYTWTNTLYIAGISTLTFSTDYTSKTGVGVQSIVINVAGSLVTYSRYITSCQETSELEWVTIEAPIRKILVGGHLFILRDGNIYNVHGVRVR